MNLESINLKALYKKTWNFLKGNYNRIEYQIGRYTKSMVASEQCPICGQIIAPLMGSTQKYTYARIHILGKHFTHLVITNQEEIQTNESTRKLLEPVRKSPDSVQRVQSGRSDRKDVRVHGKNVLRNKLQNKSGGNQS